MQELTTVDIINKHVLATLNNITVMYSNAGMSRVFIDRASSTRIENLVEVKSMVKFKNTISALDEEFKHTNKQSYREILFSATTRLIYTLTLEDVWEKATEAVINTLSNHIRIEENRTSHTDITKSKMLLSEAQSTGMVMDELRSEKWLIAYCLIIMFLSDPLNVLRLDEYSDKS